MMLKLFGKRTASKQAETVSVAVSWTKGQWLIAMTVRVLLWLLVLCGVLALAGVGYLMMQPSPTVHESVEPEEPEGRDAASELAQRAVVMALTSVRGEEEQFVELLPRVQLPAEASEVENVAVANVMLDEGVWVVTVGADVDGIRRYYQVPIAPTENGLTVLMLPSQVAAPQVNVADTQYRVQVPSSDPVAAAANEFLGALLAGAGDVSRYTAPNSEISAVQPAPYAAVSLEISQASTQLPDSPSDGDEVELYVRAKGNTADGREARFDYVLELTLRASRWEVSALKGAPIPSSFPSEDPPN